MPAGLKPADAAAPAGPTASARRTVAIERDGLEALCRALDDGLAAPFEAAIARIRAATDETAPPAKRGRVIVTGMGKSGHIARKIAATLASTGTPAFFVHPAEASHGDLGMVTPADVILALSASGETAELRSLVEYSRRWEIGLIALTAAADSTLARQSDIVLLLPRAAEASAQVPAPTTSTAMQLALGDALAIALLESRGFDPQAYHALHPGGRLGANLHFVGDVMHAGEAMPLARLGDTMSEAIVTMSGKRFGCVGIVDHGGALVGIVTDGDLRRHLAGPDLLVRRVDDVMTRAPRTIAPDALVGTALDVLNQMKITVLFVVEDRRPVGIVHMHDLLRIGVA